MSRVFMARAVASSFLVGDSRRAARAGVPEAAALPGPAASATGTAE